MYEVSKKPEELIFPQESRMDLEVNQGWRKALTNFTPFWAGSGVAQLVTYPFSNSCRTGVRSRAAHLRLLLARKRVKTAHNLLENQAFCAAAQPLYQAGWLLYFWMEGKGLERVKPASSSSIVLLLHCIYWKSMFAVHPAVFISNSNTNSSKTLPDHRQVAPTFYMPAHLSIKRLNKC